MTKRRLFWVQFFAAGSVQELNAEVHAHLQSYEEEIVDVRVEITQSEDAYNLHYTAAVTVVFLEDEYEEDEDVPDADSGRAG